MKKIGVFGILLVPDVFLLRMQFVLEAGIIHKFSSAFFYFSLFALGAQNEFLKLMLRNGKYERRGAPGSIHGVFRLRFPLTMQNEGAVHCCALIVCHSLSEYISGIPYAIGESLCERFQFI